MSRPFWERFNRRSVALLNSQKNLRRCSRTMPLGILKSQAALTRGALRPHAWVYEIESGNVMAFDDHTGQYLPVAEAGRGVAERADRLSAIRHI